MDNTLTRLKLIEFIRINSPDILGLNRMHKKDLLDIHLSITKKICKSIYK